jgi:tubulin monoglycylase TTLL3/8
MFKPSSSKLPSTTPATSKKKPSTTTTTATSKPSPVSPVLSSGSAVIREELSAWRRKRGLSEKVKVFSLKAATATPLFREALFRRAGWWENLDNTTPYWDFCWTTRGRVKDWRLLRPGQIINHFVNNAQICTKRGLCKTVMNAGWMVDVDVDSFFPRCFTNDTPEDLEAFVDQFSVGQVYAVLRRLVDPAWAAGWQATLAPGSKGELREVERAKLAVRAARRQVELSASYLCEDDAIISATPTPPAAAADSRMGLTAEEWAHLLSPSKYLRAQPPPPPPGAGPEFRGLAALGATAEEVGALAEAFERCGLMQGCGVHGALNAWILKPGAKSRGRGIECANELHKIKAIIEEGAGPKGMWVVQKYVERPLILAEGSGRKFDIRQWVLVSSLNPLVVYMYRRCYLRWSSVPFSLDNLGDKLVHLTNHSIHKNAVNDEDNSNNKDDDGEDDDLNDLDQPPSAELDALMWHSARLEKVIGSDKWAAVREGFKQIVVATLTAGRESVDHRPGSFECYGFDFLLDEDLRPWLLEVNSSPTFERTTTVTRELVPDVVEDILKVVVDGTKKAGSGDWELIHSQSTAIPHPLSAITGLSLTVEGKKVKK